MSRVPAILLVFAVFAAACSQNETATTEGPPPSVITPVTTAPRAPATTTSLPTMTESTTTTSEPSPPPPVSTTGAPLPTTSPPTTDPPPTTVPLDDLNLVLEAVADGFDQPVLAVSPPGDPRLFVVDQPGRIWVVENDEVHEFLDIRDAVRFRGEQGLLGLAFHPGYSDNGLFYVDFTNSRGGTVLSEFQVDPSNPNEARPGTRRDVLLVSQPATNHNGGMIAFGPDGLLWLGLGDGGGANDRYRNGQRSDRRLASMLRIEVGPDAPEPFGDPVDAPFLNDGGLPEVWSVGLRNPWRFSFDRDRLYIGDVGQNNIEEINVVPAAEGGINFGWPILEGSDCFRATSCNTDGRRAPVLEYTHRRGCSVTGGFVYRGSAIPELTGHYFFGDYCSGWVESIVVGDDFSVTDRREWFDAGTIPGLTSFGLDASGEIYVMGVGGVVYRIVRG